MEKPVLLRREIEKHLPEIAQNPEKLTLFVSNGTIHANKATLSHETRYTLSVLITDFVGNQDVLRTLIIGWLQDNQPDIIGPGAHSPIRFEADILGHNSADILIELQLSERTRALSDESGAIAIDHPKGANHYENLLGVCNGHRDAGEPL